jgi:putative ABC transport system substrate-binding protein
MSKKILGFVVATVLVGSVHAANAQQPGKVSRIGLLRPTRSADPTGQVLLDAFRQRLSELGWSEGKNIAIEYRYAEGKLDRLPELAVELVRLKVDLIVAPGTRTALAAKQATQTIPIVFPLAADAVGSGLVASLARPGGNITGLTAIAPDLAGKRLELIREAVPKTTRVAVLWDGGRPANIAVLKEIEAAARAFGVQVQSLEARAAADFAGAFRAATQERANALIVPAGNLLFSHRQQIASLAIRSRLPSIYDSEEFVDAGGLMSYGPSLVDLCRRAATYVDKILKGAKPADLPVEQPIKFELVINLKAAKQIGLTIPQSVLYRADRVIK